MVVLATKLYVDGDARGRAEDSLASLVANRLSELEVSADIGVRDDGFPSVTLDGPDATAARNLLAEEFGTIRPQISDGERAVGTLEAWDDDGFVLDIGHGRERRLPASELDLGPGSPEQLRTRFGLVQHLPLTFVEGDPPRLAEGQVDRLYEWTRGDGRVNVNSATRSEVRATVNRAGHAEDIVTVERLGLLEQSIVCRADTDPPGLLASIGQHLPAELLCVVP
ncbi:MAG: DUF2110 family protein [Haloarculaceae archaeon]